MFVDYFKNLAKNYQFESGKIKQNDPRLLPIIRAKGCFFRTLAGMAETHLQKYLTANQINYLYNECSQNPSIMNENCYMYMGMAKLIEYAGDELRHSLKAFRRGLFEKDTFTFWKPGYESYTDTAIQYKTKSGAHFCQGDRSMREIWDPWEGKLKKLYLQSVSLFEVTA
jgi:hypothetical protein